MKRKAVLITGSSQGLGKSLALEFSKNNYDIIIHGRNFQDLYKTEEEIKKNKVDCYIVKGDLNLDETINKLSNIAKEKDISTLINNVAIDLNFPFENFDLENLEYIFKTNLISPIKLTKKIYELFLEKKQGTIINILSTEILSIAKEGRIGYYTTKYGLRGFTDALKPEARKNNIVVMGVYPTGMNTDMYERGGKDRSKGMKTEEVAKIIFNASQSYSTACVEDIVINRSRYL